jgi:hypothetical protein
LYGLVDCGEEIFGLIGAGSHDKTTFLCSQATISNLHTGGSVPWYQEKVLIARKGGCTNKYETPHNKHQLTKSTSL